jgi:small subunit ribosomal protein S6
VLAAGGVVRGITNWGTFTLPKPARKQGATYNEGHYFILRFDSSARTQHTVRRTLGLDPRMIRYSVVQMGSKLQEIKDVAGKAEWKAVTNSSGPL